MRHAISAAGHEIRHRSPQIKPPVLCCRLHMPREVWIRINHTRRLCGQMLAASVNPILSASGALLRQIEIRDLLHRWEINPEFEANMIALSAADQKRVDTWLSERGFDLDHLPETRRPMTPCRRGFVVLRVALHRSAIRRDAKWFAEKAAIEATLPAWDSDPDGAERQPFP